VASTIEPDGASERPYPGCGKSLPCLLVVAEQKLSFASTERGVVRSGADLELTSNPFHGNSESAPNGGPSGKTILRPCG
jgi:hypothetical protein